MSSSSGSSPAVTGISDCDFEDPHDPPRRNAARLPLAAQVQLRRSAQHNYQVQIHDLSPAGCKIEFIERPLLDETVWVKFEGIEAIEATVRWTGKAVVGLHFIRPLHEAIFASLMARYRGS
jgi:hypothetical protein